MAVDLTEVGNKASADEAAAGEPGPAFLAKLETDLRAWKPTDRDVSLARFCWYCELVCVLLTALYTAIVIQDIAIAQSPADRYSSPAWFSEGFCVWATDGDERWDSHTISFAFDLLFGPGLTWLYYKQMMREHATSAEEQARRKPLMGAVYFSVGAAFFVNLHGIAHLGLHALPDLLVARNDPYLSLSFVGEYVGSFFFLAVCPFAGYAMRVPTNVCVIAHIVAVFAFLHVPEQFAFGAVQLFFNLWFCVPRLIVFSKGLIERRDPDCIRERVYAGWFLTSIGFLLLMPIVFSEMLFCDLYCRRWMLGHFAFDAGVVVFTAIAGWEVAGCVRDWDAWSAAKWGGKKEK